MTGVTHLSDSEPIQTCKGDGLGLNDTEVEGLKVILEHLNSLPESKKAVPKEIVRYDLLVNSLKVIY